jgi:hypothetical protein
MAFEQGFAGAELGQHVFILHDRYKPFARFDGCE